MGTRFLTVRYENHKYEVNSELCIECGTCASVCPVEAPELDA